jgi:hypothetical protein
MVEPAIGRPRLGDQRGPLDFTGNVTASFLLTKIYIAVLFC